MNRTHHASVLTFALLLVARSASLAEDATFTVRGEAPHDVLGRSVAISGDTAVVGAAGDGGGAVHVLVRSADGWAQQARLTAADTTEGDLFGFSVAISGDTLVVGAPGDDDGGSSSGSAYVFVRRGGGWAEQAKLTASGGAAGDSFGASVAVSGDVVQVGAGRFDGADASRGPAFGLVRRPIERKPAMLMKGGSGRAREAHVFVRSGITWTQQAKRPAIGKAGWDAAGGLDAVPGFTAKAGEPEIVNGLLQLIECIGCFSYHPEHMPDLYPIEVTFRNVSSSSIVDPFFEVVTLNGPGCPCAVVGSGGEGALIPIDAGGDGVLTPGEEFTHRFDISLTNHAPFNFFVNILGCLQTATCPCSDFLNWSDIFAGLLWADFAQGAFSAGDTTCSDDGTLTELVDDPPEADPSGASVDASVPECRAFSPTVSGSLGITAAEAAACRQELLDAWEAVQGAGTPCP